MSPYLNTDVEREVWDRTIEGEGWQGIPYELGVLLECSLGVNAVSRWAELTISVVSDHGLSLTRVRPYFARSLLSASAFSCSGSRTVVLGAWGRTT